MSYKQLAAWQTQFGDAVNILLFPSDEFGAQELPSPQIAPFVQGYGLSTDGSRGCRLMSKVRVNGPDADAVWQVIAARFEPAATPALSTSEEVPPTAASIWCQKVERSNPSSGSPLL